MLLSREDVDDKDDENEHEADEGHNDHNDVARQQIFTAVKFVTLKTPCTWH